VRIAQQGNFNMADWVTEWFFDHPDGPLHNGIRIWHDLEYHNIAPTGKGIRLPPTIGRNDPCPCGSGRKYKRCHGG